MLKRTGDFASAPVPALALKRMPVNCLAVPLYTTGAMSVPAKFMPKPTYSL